MQQVSSSVSDLLPLSCFGAAVGVGVGEGLQVLQELMDGCGYRQAAETTSPAAGVIPAPSAQTASISLTNNLIWGI